MQEVHARSADQHLVGARNASLHLRPFHDRLPIKAREVDASETLRTLVRAGDKSKRGVLELELCAAMRCYLNDFGPFGSHSRRLVALNLGCGDTGKQGTLRAQLPVRSGGHPWAVACAAARPKLFVDLKKTAPRVARVKLHAVVATGNGEPMHDSYVEQFDSLAPGRMAVALGDHHVTPIATSPVEVARSGRVLLDGCNHLDELIADGEQGIFKPEPGDTGVSKAGAKVEYLCEQFFDRLKPLCHQGNLS